jgi:hypothetical protein
MLFSNEKIKDLITLLQPEAKKSVNRNKSAPLWAIALVISSD